MYTYEIFCNDGSLGKYKTWTWLRKRLGNLAQYSNLEDIFVAVREDGKIYLPVHVKLSRNDKGFKWETKKGIPRLHKEKMTRPKYEWRNNNSWRSLGNDHRY